MKPARGFFLGLSVLLAAAATVNLANVPISRLHETWWRDRFMQKQQELRDRRVDIMWIGDSITQDWERDGPQPWLRFRPIWERFYGSRAGVNLGFKGDSTCHVLWRLTHGELDDVHPKVAILLVGANNFGRVHTDAEATLQGIETIVALLRHKLPQTDIILFGVLPSIRSAWVDANTVRLNAALARVYANQAMITFVDATSIFMRDGKVDPADFIDPKLDPPEPALHPTASSQERMAELIEPLVRKAMSAPRH